MIVARHTLAALLCAIMLNACTSQQASLRQEELASAFPEVRQIVFLGNEKFGDARLRQAMATQQRPLLSPWKRASDYNPSAVDADLLRLQKYYFDRGYLDVRATVAEVEAGRSRQHRPTPYSDRGRQRHDRARGGGKGGRSGAAGVAIRRGFEK